jgi:hypothetical protein
MKQGWVWYLKEKPCVQSGQDVCFDPTLASGQESPVAFGAGESPVGAPYAYMTGGDVWPLG